MTTTIEQQSNPIKSALDNTTTTQSKATLSSAVPLQVMHCRRIHMGYLAVLLEPTGNLEGQWQGQASIAVVRVWVRLVLHGRRSYVVI
jgi:hypothetical protein